MIRNGVRRLAGTVLAALLAMGARGAQPPPEKREQALKAQFIVEIASQIRPARARPVTEPYLIAVVGESPFRDELETYAGGRTIQGRPIQVRYFTRIPGQACDLLFLCRSEWPRAKAILAGVHDKGVLTVAEGEDLAPAGVMVNLFVEGSRLKIGLNLRSLDQEGFTYGGQILQVARILVPLRGKSQP